MHIHACHSQSLRSYTQGTEDTHRDEKLLINFFWTYNIIHISMHDELKENNCLI